MTNYTVAYSKSGIPVRLAEGIVSGSVGLYVGEYEVLVLREDGRIRLHRAIPKKNDAGLKVDEEGRIELVDYEIERR